MLEFLEKRSSHHAIEMLKDDHKKVKALFKEFEHTDNQKEKIKIASKACLELKLHSAVEEGIFYPAVRAEINDDNLMNEADEEHHEAKVLIAELESMDGTESHYNAKFHVLSENILHHVREEEDEMLPKAEGTKLDFETLGEKMTALKEKLKENGFPEEGEARMVAASHGRGDSPAAHSHKKVSVSHKS